MRISDWSSDVCSSDLLVHVVEGHVGYDHSAHRNGLKPPHGGDFASAPDPRVDPEQGRLRPFSGKFMRKRPARRLRNKAQPRLPIQPIDLIDDPIDVIRHISPPPFDGAVMLDRKTDG